MCALNDMYRAPFYIYKKLKNAGPRQGCDAEFKRFKPWRTGSSGVRMNDTDLLGTGAFTHSLMDSCNGDRRVLKSLRWA